VGESKITLTFSYYFHIGSPEQFHHKSSDSKVQRFQVTATRQHIQRLAECRGSTLHYIYR